jgi:putative teichuronic acid biosynthesis glycosyl transferase
MPADLTLAICMYNAAQYLQATLVSVLQQTKRDFHLLIIDDCSTDDSCDMAIRILQANSRQYELIRFEKNGGIGHARHFAERHATTKYMMFLDADDILYPDAIEKLYAKICSDPDLMAVGCYLEYINQKGKKIGGGIFLGEKTKEGFYEKAKNKKLIFMQPTAIYEREVALSVGGYKIDGYPAGRPRYQDFCEDLDLWTRMSDLYTENKAIVVIPEVLCKYRKVGSGLSSSSLNMILKMKYVKQNLLRRRANEQELSFIEFYNSIGEEALSELKRDADAADSLRNGVFLLKSGSVGKGIKLIARSIRLRPGYIIDKIKHNLLRK